MKSKKYILSFKKNELISWTLYWTTLGVGFFILIFFITTTWIGVEVHERCLVAKGKYKNDDCVEALITLVDDESASLHERNYAIWSLGQLGDTRAKEVLEKYYTGIIPDREPYDKTLSQYEMKKALKLLDTGFNLTHFVWKPNRVR